jgi:glycosyltransferase involved in cell wall biosynthesis
MMLDGNFSTLGRPLRVAVMVDLDWGPNAGGHVKCWERFAAAALDHPADVDLTVFVSGSEIATTELGANVRFVTLPPVFSTQRLGWLTGNLPDHTDLSPWHWQLAERLTGKFDVLHTTDAFFAFAKTARRVAERTGVPLVNSIHTATPELTRLFARRALLRMAGGGRLGQWLVDDLRLPDRAGAAKVADLTRHQSACAYALVSRQIDADRAQTVLSSDRVRWLRRGADRGLFSPARRDRAWLRTAFGVPEDAVLLLYVGRLDPSKNVERLAEAVRLATAAGAPLVLLCAGEGHSRAQVAMTLDGRAFCPGRIEGEELARVYASADLFALPSEIEVYGNVVVEALASGVPALVAERGGMGFLVDPGRTGLVVSGDGPEPWARALVSLANDRARLASMREVVCQAAPRLLPAWDDVFLEDLLPVWRDAVTLCPT